MRETSSVSLNETVFFEEEGTMKKILAFATMAGTVLSASVLPVFIPKFTAILAFLLGGAVLAQAVFGYGAFVVDAVMGGTPLHCFLVSL